MPIPYKPRSISAEALADAIARVEGSGLYVAYAGFAKKNTFKGYGRGPALLAATGGKTRPVPLGEAFKRAANSDGELVGYEPTFVRSALSLAAGAKPSVFFLLERDKEGNFRAATNNGFPYPDVRFSAKPFKPGDIVIRAAEPKVKALPAPEKVEA